MGNALQGVLRGRSLAFRAVSRGEVDYTRREGLMRVVEEAGASFVINAAGYTGKPNVDACERDKAACLLGNAVLPGVVAEVCREKGIAWGHVSSGCVFTGEGPRADGFREDDAPNFCFRTNHCSFYSGTKALGEEALGWREVTDGVGGLRWESEGEPDGYLWRLRIPFNEEPNPRNYLQKVITYKRLLQATNSLSHLGEFAEACVQCWTDRVPFGIYNLTNPGRVTTQEVTAMMLAENRRREGLGQSALFPQVYDFFESEAEFMSLAATAPRSNCVLNTEKARAAGIAMTPVSEAIERCLRAWPAG